MGQHHGLHRQRQPAPQVERQGAVRAVSEAGGDPLPGGERVPALVEHLLVVVRLDEQHRGALDGGFHLRRDMAEVGHQHHRLVPALDPEADRFPRVVRRPEGNDPQRADRGVLSGANRNPDHRLLRNSGERGPGAGGGEDRNAVPVGEAEGAPRVVAVLVGDQDRLHRGRLAAGAPQASFEIPAGQPGFDEQRGAAAGDQRGVAGTAGAEDAEVEGGSQRGEAQPRRTEAAGTPPAPRSDRRPPAARRARD